MDKVKSAVGLGKPADKESGEEPVSGETGEGTTADPFDAGNKQAQEAAEGAETAADKQESTAETTEGTNVAQSTDSDSPKDSKKGGSNFLKSVNPFNKRKSVDKTTDSQASAGASQPTPQTEPEEEKNLPPNHLGVNVPEGASLDFAPSQAPESTSPQQQDTKQEEKGKGKMASEEQSNQSLANASADGANDEGSFGQPGLLNPDRSGSTGRSGSNSGQATAQAQKLRGSRASIAEPTKQRIFNPHSINPGRIPTAGGVAVGSRPYEERRRGSRISSDLGSGQKSPPAPPVDKDGSPDPVTETHTQLNTTPSRMNGEGSSKDIAAAPEAEKSDDGPPMFKESLFEDTSAGAEKNDSATASNTATSTTETPSTTDKLKEKTNLGTSSTSSPSATKERRGSTMEKLKKIFK